MDGEKYCQFCLHFRANRGWLVSREDRMKYGKCAHTSARRMDYRGDSLVSPSFTYTYASKNRSSTDPDACGVDGKHWEQSAAGTRGMFGAYQEPFI